MMTARLTTTHLKVHTDPVDCHGDRPNERKFIAALSVSTERKTKVKRYGAWCTVTVTFVGVT